MLKILYMLPALAILGTLPAADAATDQELQERIDILQAKVDRLQERIDAADPDRDAKRIDKWEEKIAKHEGRIAELQARMEGQPANTARLTGTPEEPEPRALKQTSGDTTPPTVLSATLDGSTLTVVFDEKIDLSAVHLEEILLGEYTLAAASLDRTADDSDTLILALTQASLDTISGSDSPALDFNKAAVTDTAGNGILPVTVPITVTNAPETPTEETPTEETPDSMPMIATVTITAGGEFDVDAGTVEITRSGSMEFAVEFTNNHGRDHEILADAISHNDWHSGADIEIARGETVTETFTIKDTQAIRDMPTVYLVFGVGDDPNTPEREPDTIRGDQLVKIRITEPAS